MRVRAVVAYDGTDYHGFQRQSAQREPSIQGRLEQALAAIGQGQAAVLGSGRTDAGVHASGQVVAFDVEWRHTWPALQRALNANLPPAIAVLELQAAAPGFHPRYDAHSRTYVYTLYNAPVRHPLHSRFSWHVPEALAVDRMAEACQCLLGQHDFAAFGQPTGRRPGESTVRLVYEAACWRETGGAHVYVAVEASGFLYRMMRSIVGTLVAVGRDRCGPERVAAILASRERGQAETPAPAHGLCLTQVKYL